MTGERTVRKGRNSNGGPNRVSLPDAHSVVVEDLPVLSVLVLGLPTPSRLRKRPNRSKWTKGSEKEKRTVRNGLKDPRKKSEPFERD